MKEMVPEKRKANGNWLFFGFKKGMTWDLSCDSPMAF